MSEVAVATSTVRNKPCFCRNPQHPELPCVDCRVDVTHFAYKTDGQPRCGNCHVMMRRRMAKVKEIKMGIRTVRA